MTQTPNLAWPRRVPALDGLRGVAALIVLVHHALLIHPYLAMAYQKDGVVTGWAAWIVYGPAHLAWAGTEAVYVFFVLSGFVLTLPFLDPGVPRRWQAYYSSRLVRLYVPVVLAVAVASVLFLLFPRSDLPTGASWWLSEHNGELTARLVIDNMTLRHASILNGPLWSLRWEVIFSIVLPVFVLLARRIRGVRAAVACALLLIAVAVGSAINIQALVFMPMFGLGSVMASNAHDLRTWMITSIRSQQCAIIVAIGLALVIWNWWPLIGQIAPSAAPAAAGAMLLVFVSATSTRAQRISNAQVIQWLGSRSFSIYLVHEPIIISCAIALDTTNPAVVLAVGLPIALVASEGFFRLAERPAHRLATRINRAVRNRGRKTSVDINIPTASV